MLGKAVRTNGLLHTINSLLFIMKVYRSLTVVTNSSFHFPLQGPIFSYPQLLMSCFYFLLLPRHLLPFQLIAFFISFSHFQLYVLYHADLCALYNLHAYILHPSPAVYLKIHSFRNHWYMLFFLPFLMLGY